MRVYRSRHVKPTPPGSDIAWIVGEIARYTTLAGTHISVEIMRPDVYHHDAPGVICCDVRFPDGVFCVSADQLAPMLSPS